MPIDPRQTARFLADASRDGRFIETLPAELRPANRAEAYAVQAALEGFSAHPLFGWKIAATSTAGQQHINVGGPLAGRLLAERVFPGGTAITLEDNQMLVVEGEFAFRMARDLPPRRVPYTRDEVKDAVATLHPAIEVPNSRFKPFERAGEAQLIADNACAEYFLLGDASPGSWREIDLVSHTVTAVDGSGQDHVGSGASVLGDPLLALAWIANELSSIGVTLAAGQVVTTGTCFKPFAVKPGDHVRMDFGVFGGIDVRFAAK
jgi:2-keto-4-pentenoate hydratase